VTDPGKVLIVMTVFGGMTIITKLIVSTVLRYREMELKHFRGGDNSETLARLERMEHAVDAIAIEIERISEGQRFTTKLLSERSLNSSSPVAR
jgi:hypothetical protein